MATVPVIGLVCVQEEGNCSTELTVCAMLDTEADFSIGIKKLAEKLFGWAPNDTINFQFLQNSPDQYSCMIRSVQLGWSDQDRPVANLPYVPFVDITILSDKTCQGKMLCKNINWRKTVFHFAQMIVKWI